MQDINELELLKNAKKRIQQKKMVYYHWVIFILGVIFVGLGAKLTGKFQESSSYHLYVYTMVFWAFLVSFHTVKVFVLNSVLGKEWETEQRQKLVLLQKTKIQKIQEEAERLYSQKNN